MGRQIHTVISDGLFWWIIGLVMLALLGPFALDLLTGGLGLLTRLLDALAHAVGR